MVFLWTRDVKLILDVLWSHDNKMVHIRMDISAVSIGNTNGYGFVSNKDIYIILDDSITDNPLLWPVLHWQFSSVEKYRIYLVIDNILS
jgi:hypothetical protein